MKGLRGTTTIFAATLAAVLAGPSAARAGGGPENVFLVVNSASWASQTVANHYIELRQLPPINVFYINWLGGFTSIDGERFRQELLGPIITTIAKRGLTSQIDYVLYSSDFPYAIDLTRDFSGTPLIAQAQPQCSINSATYLWHFLFSKSSRLLSFDVNHYMRWAPQRTVAEPTRGFRSWYGWGGQGQLIEAGGQPYMLSTMLGITSGRGNSVSEVINYLRSSAAADGTHPKGTIYFCHTDDVRSTTRAPQFRPAISELEKLGVRGEVVSTALPVGRDDVLGVMSGVPDFSWLKTRSTILPGAICENFTSFGGQMYEGAGQTPLTEFLRYGAAGSSGTVVEPYSMWQKFPSAFVHVHYARGCTLAEAYYQSLFAPAQVLIVGDALCRPWADIPRVEVGGLPADGKIAGTVVLTPQATSPGKAAIDRYELFVDGHRMGAARAASTLSWDSTAESDGYHELRVVAIQAGAIETQGRAIIPVTVNNHQRTIQLTATPAGSVRWGETLKVRVAAPGMSTLLLVHNNRVLGQVSGEQGEIDVDPRLLGLGPVSLQAVGTAGNTVALRVWSAPLKVTVQPGPPLPALANPPANMGRGLVLQLPDQSVLRVNETSDPAWLTLKGVRANQPFVLQGFFDVAAEDVYQFQVSHTGELKLSVDGQSLYSAAQGDNTQKLLPVALAAGTHRLTATGRTAGDARLNIRFGGPGALSLSSQTFRHAR